MSVQIVLVVIDENDVVAKDSLLDALVTSSHNGTLDMKSVFNKFSPYDGNLATKTQFVGIGTGMHIPLLDHIDISIINTLIISNGRVQRIDRIQSDLLFTLLEDYVIRHEIIIIPIVSHPQSNSYGQLLPYLQWVNIMQPSDTADVIGKEVPDIVEVVNDGLYVDNEPRYVPPLI